ncbi:hypothetical protein DSC45_31620 [Streptomyces sp. YIM 130001]|uniref:hypothetical protein n=1 Tax=Streptomyces sp. YIM 130001 TaxID=2259644 RepID=UPI000EEE1D7D|nr:hypothetical protein [Streptomyces sp. YIM 130001]RII09238.1 hypothetical protein DSC45_31620 [Streptomyces sp. YIM 130001]
MRSLKIATGTVLASAAMVFAVPVTAHAAPAGCEAAQSQAIEAQDDYEAAKKQYEGGDTSLKEQVAEAEQNANSLASEAQRLCGDTVMDPSAPASPTTPPTDSPSAPATQKPSGAMHAGSGSTSSDPSSVPALAAAGGLAVVAGAGFALRRRSGGQHR